MKGAKASILLTEDAKPVARRARTIPAPLEEEVVRKLKAAVEDGIIEATEEFSGWQHALVVAFKKSGEARLCVDLRPLNKYVVRQPQPFPTFEEMSALFEGATVFSKIDIQDAFYQIELDENSRHLTTFATGIGTFRYTRLPFGLASAPEFFQRELVQRLKDLPGVVVFMDDINVYGKDINEHDERLAAVLKRLSTSNLRINMQKCEFAKDRLEFLGYIVDAKGMSPSPAKIAALKSCRPPQSKEEAQSFLGMISYVGHRFIPDLATVSEPIRKLTRKGQTFRWEEEQQRAFKKLLHLVEEITTLSFYSLTDKTLVFADASPYALGGVLAQESPDGSIRPIAFASRSLNETDQRLSQTEKEAMALVWSIEHFDYFLKGRRFDLYTDHKPLEVIFGIREPTSCLTSARIERWLLRIQEYDFRVKYVPGRKMIADFMSRASAKGTNEPFDIGSETAINSILEATCEALTEETLRQESKDDTQFKQIRAALLSDTWPPELRRFELMKGELADIDGVLLRGQKIIVPGILRQKVLELAHEGHPGIGRMKSRLRCKYWWPGIGTDVEKTIAICKSCRLVSMSFPAEPLKRTELPEGPWEQIGIDFLGPMPSGEKLLVIIDYFSRFALVAIMRDTSAKKVIEELQIICNVYGYPRRCMADNGPPFASAEFEKWAKASGIHLLHSIPYQPRINGEVERFNRTLVKSLTISMNSGISWRKGLEEFLASYRQTPHSVTGIPPAELFLKRKVRDKLPSAEFLTLPEYGDEELLDKDRIAKQKGKTYADERYHHKLSDLKEGDKVLVKRQSKTKWETRNHPIEFTVLRKQGPAVIIQGPDGKQYHRDISHLTRAADQPEIESNAREGSIERADQLINPNASSSDDEDRHDSAEQRKSPTPSNKQMDGTVTFTEGLASSMGQETEGSGVLSFVPPVASTPMQAQRIRKRPKYLLDYTK